MSKNKVLEIIKHALKRSEIESKEALEGIKARSERVSHSLGRDIHKQTK